MDNMIGVSKNKTIKEIIFDENYVKMIFEEGGEVTLKDIARNCCESRYMSMEGDNVSLTYYEGAQLYSVTVEDGPDIEDSGECHEVSFLHITTSKGSFVISSHNEHNGWYGGFSIIAEEKN